MEHIFEQQAQSQLYTNIIDQQFYMYILVNPCENVLTE